MIGRTALVLALGLAVLGGGATAAAADPGARPAKDGRPLLLVMNEVVEGLWPRLKEPPAAEARRVSVKRGLLGVGSYEPPGGSGRGLRTPPLHLFPRAGLGNSLGVDPNTGRSYWTHLP